MEQVIFLSSTKESSICLLAPLFSFLLLLFCLTGKIFRECLFYFVHRPKFDLFFWFDTIQDESLLFFRLVGGRPAASDFVCF